MKSATEEEEEVGESCDEGQRHRRSSHGMPVRGALPGLTQRRSKTLIPCPADSSLPFSTSTSTTTAAAAAAAAVVMIDTCSLCTPGTERANGKGKQEYSYITDTAKKKLCEDALLSREEKRKKKKEKRRDMQSFVHAFIHSFIRWSAGSLPCPSPLSRPSLARLAAIVEHTHVSFMHSTTVVALLFFLFSFFFSFLFLFCESEFLFHGLKSRG